MNIRILINITVVIYLFLAGCKNKVSDNKSINNTEQQELQGEISISGAFALYPMTIKWANEFQKIHPEVRINISAGGAGKGMTDALSQMVDLGMVSRGISEEEIKKGAWFVAVTKDAVLPTINVENPVLNTLKTKGLTRQKFYNIFITEKIKTWRELVEAQLKSLINVYTRSDACGAAEMWAKYLGKNQENLKGIGVFGDPGIADAVKKDKFSIGYNNVCYIYDIKTRKKFSGLEIIPIDLNENTRIDTMENFYNSLDEIIEAVKNGKYPSPPARELFLVSKGKPSKNIVKEFLRWILSEGQKYVNECGYVELPKQKLELELQKLR
ncbi:MAG: extracellular solute-binding protein [Bacteroidia bacterium]|nr:extracellular solute-binding protein [Bacteroidia bacterium]